MVLKRTGVTLASLLLLAGLAGCDLGMASGYDLENTVIDGTSSPTDGAVVKLLAANGRGLCSGTLIGQSYVLTAAHCRGAAATAHYGNQAGATDGMVTVAEFREAAGTDLAVARLSQPIPATYPRMALNGVDLSGSIGMATDIVGFGVEDLGGQNPGAGTRRMGRTQLASVTRAQDYGELGYLANNAGQQFCYGDSGGLARASMSIPGGGSESVHIGVISHVRGPTITVTNGQGEQEQIVDCASPQTQGGIMRTDRYLTFITNFMAEGGETPRVFNGQALPPEAPQPPGGGTPPTVPPGTTPQAPGPAQPQAGGTAAGCSAVGTNSGIASSWLLLLGAVALVRRRRRN